MYSVSCKKNTLSKSSSVRSAKQNRLVLGSSFAVCGQKKYKCIKNQEANRLLSKLRIRTSISNIPLIDDIFKAGNSVAIIFEMINLK